MMLLREYREDVPRLRRFSLVARIAHWAHAFFFIACLLSGLVIFFGREALALPFGGMAGASLVHKIAAVGLTLSVLLYLVVGFPSVMRWAGEIARFGRNDVGFLFCFPKKLFGLPVKSPPQTKLNGGEKINSVVTSFCVLALIATGWVMWFPEGFGLSLARWSYLLHTVAMIVSASAVCVHAYLGSLHPETGESFWGMWKGTVREDWARRHHALWVEELSTEPKEEPEAVSPQGPGAKEERGPGGTDAASAAVAP